MPLVLFFRPIFKGHEVDLDNRRIEGRSLSLKRIKEMFKFLKRGEDMGEKYS